MYDKIGQLQVSGAKCASKQDGTGVGSIVQKEVKGLYKEALVRTIKREVSGDEGVACENARGI